VSGNRQSAFATDGHADNTNVPALDDLALADLERKGLALLVGYGSSKVSPCVNKES
jgi:hypothetical protein